MKNMLEVVAFVALVAIILWGRFNAPSARFDRYLDRAAPIVAAHHETTDISLSLTKNAQGDRVVLVAGAARSHPDRDTLLAALDAAEPPFPLDDRVIVAGEQIWDFWKDDAGSSSGNADLDLIMDEIEEIDELLEGDSGSDNAQ